MSNKHPTLMDDNIVADLDKKINSQNGYITTDTNMMVDCFANKEKLVDESRIEYYNKNDDYENDENETRLDDDLNKYNTPQQNIFQKTQHNHTESQKTDHQRQSHNNKYDSTHSVESEPTSQQEHNVDPDDENYWTEEEMYLRKSDMLRKLGELQENGAKISQNYDMNSSYKTMKFEYELHSGIRSKRNAINWMSGMMIGIVKGMELLNDNYNPLDMKFEETWSNNVKMNIKDYYDVLGEIYEKYTKPGQKMAPELKLFLMLSGSAITIQMHKGISNMIPKVSQDLNDDPEMVKNLRKQAEMRQNQQTEKENEDIATKMADLQQINKYKNEYTTLQKKAMESETDRFTKNLVLSESSKNPGSVCLPMYNNTSIFQQRKAALQAENNNLIEMNKMLQNMQNKSNNSQCSESGSKASSASRISINPKLDKIFNNSMKQTKKQTQSKTQSDEKSTSSKSKSISFDISDELNEEQNNTKHNSFKIVSDNNNIENINLDNISFGKSSGKRGRPPKKQQNFKMKLGKN